MVKMEELNLLLELELCWKMDLGDTIRVSLTEEPEEEAPVAIALANRYKNRSGHKEIKDVKTFHTIHLAILKFPLCQLIILGIRIHPELLLIFQNQ